MENELNQIVQAILIAYDPAQAALHQQALQFLTEVKKNTSEPWRLGLALFVDRNPDGTRKYHPQARFFGLGVLEEFLDNRCAPLEPESFRTLQQALVDYIQSEYLYGSAEATAACGSHSRCLLKRGLIGHNSLAKQILAYTYPVFLMHLP